MSKDYPDSKYIESVEDAIVQRNERLEILEGCEVISTHFEGVVGIMGGQLWQNGKIIRETIPSDELKILIDELFYQESGSREEAQRALDEEFGDG